MTLYATFETKAVEDRANTLNSGAIQYKDVDWAILRMSGDKNTALEVEITTSVLRDWANTDHKKHLAEEYKAWKNGQDAPVNGIPLKEWTNITPSEIQRSYALHIRSVEDWADINDQGLNAYGVGGMKLKQKAIAYLEAARGPGKAAERMNDMQAQIEMLKDQLDQALKFNADQQAINAALAANQGGAYNPALDREQDSEAPRRVVRANKHNK